MQRSSSKSSKADSDGVQGHSPKPADSAPQNIQKQRSDSGALFFFALILPQDLRIRHESIKFATTNSFTSYQLKYICL